MKAEQSEPFGGDPLITYFLALATLAAGLGIMETEPIPAGCPVCLLAEYTSSSAEDLLLQTVNAWKMGRPPSSAATVARREG